MKVLLSGSDTAGFLTGFEEGLRLLGHSVARNYGHHSFDYLRERPMVRKREFLGDFLRRSRRFVIRRVTRAQFPFARLFRVLIFSCDSLINLIKGFVETSLLLLRGEKYDLVVYSSPKNSIETFWQAKKTATLPFCRRRPLPL